MDRIGRELLARTKESLRKEMTSRRDLLTLLVRANMSEERGKRLSDEEVLSRQPFFMSSGVVTVTLNAIYRNPNFLRSRP
jgi:cytochrome P450